MPDVGTGISTGLGLISGRKSEKASKQAAGMSREELAFEKEKYYDSKERQDRWDSIYGPIEENLASFYSGLSGEQIANAGLEENQKAYQEAEESLVESLAQRGLGKGGLERGTRTSLEIARAEQKAEIRSEADYIAAEEKKGFLTGTRGQRPGTEGDISGAMRRNRLVKEKEASNYADASANFLKAGLKSFARANEGDDWQRSKDVWGNV